MKKDLRITRSESAIEEAFLILVEEKGFENVHLVDIAKQANVNRNTIYLRYGTKEDIIESILTKAFNEQLESLDKELIFKTRNAKRSIEKMFVSIFNVLSNQLDLYRLVMTDPNLLGYADNMLIAVRKMIFESVEDTRKNKIIVEYILKGVYGIIQQWIIYDLGSVEETIKYLTNLVYANVRHLTYK